MRLNASGEPDRASSETAAARLYGSTLFRKLAIAGATAGGSASMAAEGAWVELIGSASTRAWLDGPVEEFAPLSCPIVRHSPGLSSPVRSLASATGEGNKGRGKGCSFKLRSESSW